jgi:hypothetical protein
MLGPTLGPVGYQLVFWKYADALHQPAGEVYAALMNGERLDGLAEFPVEAYVDSVVAEFPDAERAKVGLYWTSPDERSSFEVEWSSVHVMVEVRNVSTDVGNQLVTLAKDLGAPLYDPQTMERFDSWTSV